MVNLDLFLSKTSTPSTRCILFVIIVYCNRTDCAEMSCQLSRIGNHSNKVFTLVLFRFFEGSKDQSTSWEQVKEAVRLSDYDLA